MSNQSDCSTPIQPSLDDVLAQYIAGEEAGRPLDRNQLLVAHPHLASELREFFTNRDQMQRLAEPLRGSGQPHRRNGPLGKLRYFGDYELLEEIAAGGMGIIYKARQLSLNRSVAVKMILKGTLASEDDVKRFKAEAEAAANLQHPAIVAIHEVGLHEGQHYFSMDYVDGHSLAELPREQPLSAHQAAEYIRDAAEAVYYAHQQGTLHRDLKPSNILIDRQGRVRITDFGLAKRIEGNSDLTLSGQILGTPSYMPPEQALGKRSLIAAASDIYSLGAVLYELLTGRPPFRGESPAETLRQVESLDPVSPRLLNPTTPRDLETICLKCLEKEPHKRYGTAQLLADDLGRYLRGESIVARPIRAWQRAVKWVRRHPTAVGLIVMSTIAILAVVGLLVGQSYNARLWTLNEQLAGAKTSLEARNSELSEANTALATAKASLETSNHELGEASSKLQSALVDVKAERARARRYLYAARMALVQRAEQEQQPGRIVQVLRSVIPETPDQEDLRDFEWHLLWRKYSGEESRLYGHTGPVTAVAFSPDDKWIASGSVDNTVKIWNASTGTEVCTFSGHADRVYGVAFSLDGNQLASASADGRLKVWNLAMQQEIADDIPESSALGSSDNPRFWKQFNGPIEPPLQLTGNATKCSAYNAGRTRFIEGKTTYTNTSVTARVRIVDANNDVEVVSFDLPAAITQVAFSPDGSLVAAAGLDQAVRIWNAMTGASVCTLYAADGVRSVAFSADGLRIVAGTENRLVMIWTIPGRVERKIHEGPGSANCVTFGKSGELLAAVCNSQAMVWNAFTGEKIATLPANSFRRVAMSPIHSWIAGAPPTQLTDASSQKLLKALQSGGAPSLSKGPLGYAFSRDESLVAEASGGKTIVVHSTQTGKAVHSISIPDWASSVAFNPDTTLLAAGSGDFSQGAEKRGTLLVHDLKTDRNVFEERLPLDIWALSFSPDGRLLAAAMGVMEDRGADLGRIRIWRTDNWHAVHDLRGHSGSVWSVEFNPSGTRLASAGGRRFHRTSTYTSPPGEFKIWDVVTGEEVLTIPAVKGPAYGVAFSPDGSRLATAGEDGSVRLWNGLALAESPRYSPLPEN